MITCEIPDIDATKMNTLRGLLLEDRPLPTGPDPPVYIYVYMCMYMCVYVYVYVYV